MKIRSIEISFPVEVDLPDGFDRLLSAALDMVCAAYQRAHTDRVMWPAEYGSKPHWSAVDAALLGKQASPEVKDGDEPTFDDSVFCIGMAEREDLHGENPHNPERDAIRQRMSEARAAEKARRKAAEPIFEDLQASLDQTVKGVRGEYVLKFNRELSPKEFEALRKSFE